MRVVSMCQICGAAGGMTTCMGCGKLVCTRCFDSISGRCIHCRMGTRIK